MVVLHSGEWMWFSSCINIRSSSALDSLRCWNGEEFAVSLDWYWRPPLNAFEAPSLWNRYLLPGLAGRSFFILRPKATSCYGMLYLACTWDQREDLAVVDITRYNSIGIGGITTSLILLYMREQRRTADEVVVFEWLLTRDKILMPNGES